MDNHTGRSIIRFRLPDLSFTEHVLVLKSRLGRDVERFATGEKR
jgi:hypothetical protein